MVPTIWRWPAAAAICAAVAGWLYLDNRALRGELRQARSAAGVRAASSATASSDPGRPAPTGAAARAEPSRGGLAALVRALGTPRPDAAPVAQESRMDRRSRRSAEIAALFGRLEEEREDAYRARVMPMVVAMLERPRQRAADMRREAEQQAGVTAEQSSKLDQVFATTYDELIDYTDAAIAEGQLSPYRRNVAGWLEYAGGLGGILGGTEGKVGEILRPEQVRAMSEAGFEWGEFLGVNAPWERLHAPPPPGP